MRFSLIGQIRSISHSKDGKIIFIKIAPQLKIKPVFRSKGNVSLSWFDVEILNSKETRDIILAPGLFKIEGTHFSEHVKWVAPTNGNTPPHKADFDNPRYIADTLEYIKGSENQVETPEEASF